MKTSRFLMLFAASSLSLTAAACSPEFKDASPQEKAKIVFNNICVAEPALHASFVTVALASDKISEKVIDKERQAHAFIATVCTNPPSDYIAAIVTLSNAYAAALDAKRDADNAERG